MPTDSPLVSVIVSCYNHERYIRQCIESVVLQTYPHIELIVIDDGSTDNSPAILKELSNEYGFSLHLQENKGLTRSLNWALAQSKGKYICPLGSDDALTPDKIEKQVEFMEKRSDVVMLGGNVLEIDSLGEASKKQRRQPYREVDFNAVLLSFKQGPPAPTTMIRADVLREIGGYSENTNLEDLYLWLKLTHTGHKIAILEDVLAYYRKHPRNTHKDYRFMTESIERILYEYRDEPLYLRARNKFLVSMFLKVSKKDRKYSWELFRKIKPRYYNMKVLRGLLHWLLPRK